MRIILCGCGGCIGACLDASGFLTRISIWVWVGIQNRSSRRRTGWRGCGPSRKSASPCTRENKKEWDAFVYKGVEDGWCTRPCGHS